VLQYGQNARLGFKLQRKRKSYNGYPLPVFQPIDS
jgi:hypothetical protein